MKNLKNKVVWITGASSGIGEALAKLFAQEGCRLVLSARREAELIRVKNALPSPENILVLPLDMQQTDTFAAACEQIEKHFGRIDVMVHNAGISQRGLFSETTAADAEMLMQVNFSSVVALTREVLPRMKKQGEGAFLVTSSVSGKIGTPYRTMYCASKHAIQGFFDGLRGELWRENIQVTVVCPGYIHTPISYNAIGANGQRYGKLDENQAKGIPVDVCARKMLKALKQGKREVVIAGFMENLGLFFKRFAPFLLWQFVKNYNIKAKE